MGVDMEHLKHELKELIITEGGKDISPDEIGDDEALFGSDTALALDSLDALQISVAIHRKYGKRLNDSKEAMRAFANINTLAAFIVAPDE
jgi:acyl carrier protein